MESFFVKRDIKSELQKKSRFEQTQPSVQRNSADKYLIIFDFCDGNSTFSL